MDGGGSGSEVGVTERHVGVRVDVEAVDAVVVGDRDEEGLLVEENGVLVGGEKLGGEELGGNVARAGCGVRAHETRGGVGDGTETEDETRKEFKGEGTRRPQEET